MGDAAVRCAARGDFGTFPHSLTITSPEPLAPAVSSPPGPWPKVVMGASNGFSSMPIELLVPGEPTAPFWIGAGIAKITLLASEFALAAEPAANVGAVEGAEKPPSDDIARGKKRGPKPPDHQPGYG